MEEDKVTEVLESIGLNKNEVSVYLDLIRVGKSSAGDISKRTKIHRSNTYDILEKLVKKGIVDEVVENERKVFYPIDPTDFLDYLKQKEEELRKIIPEMEKIQNKPKEERKVTISEGLNSAKNILLHLLDYGEPLAVYGMPKEVVDIAGGFIEELNRLRVGKKIPMRNILGVDSLKRVKELNSMEFTEARYLPTSYNSNISTHICGDKIVLIIWDMPISTIVIENKSVAETYRNYFEILWKETKIEH